MELRFKNCQWYLSISNACLASPRIWVWANPEHFLECFECWVWEMLSTLPALWLSSRLLPPCFGVWGRQRNASWGHPPPMSKTSSDVALISPPTPFMLFMALVLCKVLVALSLSLLFSLRIPRRRLCQRPLSSFSKIKMEAFRRMGSPHPPILVHVMGNSSWHFGDSLL